MARATMSTFTLPSSAPQAGWCSPCAAHLQPTIRRKTTEVNARLPVSSTLFEQALHRHALRVGLCVFQQIFQVLVVDRFLELLEGSAARVGLCGDSLLHLVPHPCVREAEEQAHVLREAVVVVGHEVAVLESPPGANRGNAPTCVEREENSRKDMSRSSVTKTQPQTHTSLTQKREFTVHRCVAEDAPWASSQKTHTPRKASHHTPQKARTRVAEDAHAAGGITSHAAEGTHTRRGRRNGNTRRRRRLPVHTSLAN